MLSSVLVASSTVLAAQAGTMMNEQGACLAASQHNAVGATLTMAACDSETQNHIWTYDMKTKQLKVKNGFCLHTAKQRNMIRF